MKRKIVSILLIVIVLVFAFKIGPSFLYKYGFAYSLDYFTNEERFSSGCSEEDYTGEYQIIKDKHVWSYEEARELTKNLPYPPENDIDVLNVIYTYLYTYEDYLEYIEANDIEQLFTSETNKYLVIENSHNFTYKVNTKVNDVNVSNVFLPAYRYDDHLDHNWGIVRGEYNYDIDVYIEENKFYSMFQFLGNLDPFSYLKQDENKIIIPISEVENISDVRFINVYLNNYRKYVFDINFDPTETIGFTTNTHFQGDWVEKPIELFD